MSQPDSYYDRRSGLRSSLRLLIIAGCLFMVYNTGVGSPATVGFYKWVGANEFQFGLINGLPLMMVVFQFLGAIYVPTLKNRRPLFMFTMIASRVVYLPIAFVPLYFKGTWVMTMIVCLVAASHMLFHSGVPLWFSWVGELLPQKSINRYLSERNRLCHLTWTVCSVGVTLFLFMAPWPPNVTFPLLVVFSVIAGVVDILLFLRIDQYEQTFSRPQQPVLTQILEPFRNHRFRGFVWFSAYAAFAMQFATSFMIVYAIKVLELPVWEASLITCLTGLGIFLSSKFWGFRADRHGRRPLLHIVFYFKPLIALFCILLTHSNVHWLLPIIFILDGILNSAWMVGTSAYIFGNAPKESRSMYQAVISAFSGVTGGVAAILSGTVLQHFESFTYVIGGMTLINYHLVFGLSCFFRIVGCLITHWIHEPKAHDPKGVLIEIISEFPQQLMINRWKIFSSQKDAES